MLPTPNLHRGGDDGEVKWGCCVVLSSSMRKGRSRARISQPSGDQAGSMSPALCQPSAPQVPQPNLGGSFGLPPLWTPRSQRYPLKQPHTPSASPTAATQAGRTGRLSTARQVCDYQDDFLDPDECRLVTAKLGVPAHPFPFNHQPQGTRLGTASLSLEWDLKVYPFKN